MAKKAVVLLIALALVFGVASAAWATAPGPVISNTLGPSTVVAQAAQANWEATGRMGTHNGTVYKEYKLSYNKQQVLLDVDHVSKITVEGPTEYGTKELTPNTDTTLWFNVTNPAGDYKFTIETRDGYIYEATLSWGGPMPLLVITWDLPQPKTVTVNESFVVSTTAAIKSEVVQAGVSEIGRVLYVIEVTKDGSVVTDQDVTGVAEDGQALGYDEAGFFYWGPRTGFTFSTGMYDTDTNNDGTNDCVSTAFTVTFKKPGTYTVTAYAVQLPQ